ncbi:MAG TPA: efflux RND transporter periplasmic adaptor subunit [Sandaracinaceae bacterium LLY-WYZ-13_1]|nr:efflux RND transporter periplasmic adaptor subunit [Sandaracinaceae bacterium LLY-WYZ-13_1]
METHALEEAAVSRTSQPPVDDAPPAERRRGVVGRLFAVGIPVVTCLAGAAVAGLLVATKPEAERAQPEDQGLPVRVTELSPGTQPIAVRAQGQVVAARQVVVQPELNGRVIWMNDDLVPGGRLAEGETLVRIDPRDYRAAVEAQRAQLQNSRVQIQQERSRQVVAQREWELLREGGGSDEGRELALREPQLRSAEASLRAAESNLQQARTNLTRTTVQAPFDAFVQTEQVDIGQLVGPANQLATLVGTEHFWVQVAVPMEQLRWIRLPSHDDEGGEGTPGSTATVVQEVGEHERIVRQGRVVRLLGDLDPVGRMARVLVEIDDPLGLERAQTEGEGRPLPMLLGAYVHVQIDAGELPDVYEIPRDALHAGDEVHLLGEGSRLETREVDVVWRREQTVLVRGLSAQDRLVLSQIPTPVEGTLLRRVEPEDEDPGREPPEEPAEPAE